MVSRSCLRLVKLYFSNIEGVKIRSVRLGNVSLEYEFDKIHPRQIEVHFEGIGFKVIKEENDQIVEHIKSAAIELIHWSNNTNSLIRNSDYISEKIGLPYTKLSKLFSEHYSITLEKFIILLKMEKVKTMLLEKNYSLSEISYFMGYSSVNYLSSQFKKTTGKTVSKFKKLATREDLIPLDEVLMSQKLA
jgi:YesN/AraC family two-component response regulator